MNIQPRTEDVLSDDQIRLGVVDRHPVHPEILRQERFGVMLNYVLRSKTSFHYISEILFEGGF